MPAYNTYKSTMKKNTFLILSLLLLYLYPLSASVEIRSNKLTTGDGLANNSTRYMMQDNKVNPEKPDVPLNKNDAFQKVQKRRVQEKR